MNHRFGYLFICGLWLLATCLLPLQARAASHPGARMIRIGIVTDGSTPADQAAVALFQKEIRNIVDNEHDLKFPAEFNLSGHDTRAGVKKALDKLFASPRVDIVLALGIISSSEVLSRQRIVKPVIAPYVADFVLKERERKKLSSRNLVCIDSMYYLDQDIETFRKIIPFQHVALVLDQREAEAFTNIDQLVQDFAARHHLTVDVVTAGAEADPVLEKIGQGVEAVLVGPLWHFDDEQVEILARGLIARRLPGFTIWDSHQVVLGLYAGLEARAKQDILARRTAVAVMDIILHENPSDIDVGFIRDRELTINMATARSMNILPSILTMSSARLINDQPLGRGPRLNIKAVVDESVKANLSLQSARIAVRAGQQKVEESKADLLPRIDLNSGATVIDHDRARAGAGMTPQRSWTAGASGSVLLYSDNVWAGYESEKHLQKGREMDRERVRLNVTYDASVAYLNLLRARTIERIYKDNLKLTEANLKRARIRVSTGAAGPDEVYRWQTKYAEDRRQVLYRESDSFDAMEAVNRIMHHPLEQEFLPEETTLTDPLFIMGDRFFCSMMEKPVYFNRFRRFAMEEAVSLRPELKIYDAAIKAKKRLATAAKRAYWLPEFSVDWSVDEYLADSGNGERDDNDRLDDTDWRVGVYARFPLFEGGRKKARSGRLEEEVSLLHNDQSAAAEAISQGVLRALNRTRASYPSITLTRQAAEAARKNFDLVTDSYVQGIKSIVDLLDAQNQSLNADLNAANAVYDFLIDYMGVERALGEFTIFMPEEQRRAWLEKAQQAIGMKP